MESQNSLHPKGEVELKNRYHESNNLDVSSAGFFSL